jgi:hypothetical protein
VYAPGCPGRWVAAPGDVLEIGVDVDTDLTQFAHGGGLQISTCLRATCLLAGELPPERAQGRFIHYAPNASVR